MNLDEKQLIRARAIISKVVPDEETRAFVAQVFADTIETLNEQGAARWEVTLKPGLIRVNAGRVYVLDIGRDELMLPVDPQKLAAASRKSLRRYLNQYAMTTLPHVSFSRYEYPEARKWWPELREAYLAFAREAAGTSKRCVWARAHSPEIVQVMGELAHRPLPQPEYGELPPKRSKATDSTTSNETVAPSRFEALLEQLRTKHDLTIAADVVAHYILGLQAKRFVIFTGISGTGKTKLAIALAKQFPLERTDRVAASSSPGAIEKKVRPSAHKYRRTVIPSAIAHSLRLEGVVGSGSALVDVECPSGVVACSCYRNNREGAPVHHLALQGPVGDWLQSLPVGDSYLVEVVETPLGARDRLRLFTAATVTKMVLVSNLRVIAVRPDWTDCRGLLGYWNPLTDRYVSTPFLDLLLAASDEHRRALNEGRAPHPFFAILDEMNLARVEQYFADFLSAMESGEPIPLHSRPSEAVEETDDESPAIPREVVIPPNLYFTATVNVDETTYMFSPKVLDRSFVIEFNDVNLGTYGLAHEENEAGLFDLNGWTDLAPIDSRGADEWRNIPEEAREALTNIHALLARENRHFGYRVANEIARFVNRGQEQSDADDVATLIDMAIFSKVLPKLHGTQQELTQMLADLFAFAVGPRGKESGRFDAWKIAALRLVCNPQEDDAPVLYPRSALKLWRMHRRLVSHGFTSFIE